LEEIGMKTECHGEIVAEKNGRQIIDCAQCKYMHVYPMYSEEELEEYYENVFSESTPSHLFFEKVYNVKRWIKKGTILDIGCWEGTQLEHFMKEGWECTGLELNKNAASISRSKGIQVYQIPTREFFKKFSRKKWDVINVAYLLEHIANPDVFLHEIRKNVRENGILITEVPNEFNPFQLAYLQKKQTKPYWIALPDHLNYFNKASLQKLVKRNGWKILRGEVSFPMEMFLLMGDNYLEDKSVGKRSFRKVVEMENALVEYDPELISKMYSALYKTGIGRSIVLYLKKK
jgi:2-polyprenyl-3-methyl-5-hydroxy-6-metoxy-1,4-benzoquinol methylase